MFLLVMVKLKITSLEIVVFRTQLLHLLLRKDVVFVLNKSYGYPCFAKKLNGV